jgi:hypothetical protein
LYIKPYITNSNSYEQLLELEKPGLVEYRRRQNFEINIEIAKGSKEHTAAIHAMDRIVKFLGY